MGFYTSCYLTVILWIVTAIVKLGYDEKNDDDE